MFKAVMNFVYASPERKRRIRRGLGLVGYDANQWARVVPYDVCTKWLDEIGLSRLDVLEISPGSYWRTLPFKSYAAVSYPEFDICEDALETKYDLIIADQVLEHVLKPHRAVANVKKMLKKNGHFLMITPFLIKLHAYPNDCTRWSQVGVTHLLSEVGFPMESIRTGQWGNRKCVKANLGSGWARVGWGRSLKNEAQFPVMVWAMARNIDSD